MDATPFREKEEKENATREDTVEHNELPDCSKADIGFENQTNQQAFIKEGP